MIAKFSRKAGLVVLAGVLLVPRAASASCADIYQAISPAIPSIVGAQLALVAALKAATGPLGTATTNGGFGLNMWGTIVDRDGYVCLVAFTGGDRGAQWPGSRVISAQKANTANAFSLPG